MPPAEVRAAKQARERAEAELTQERHARIKKADAAAKATKAAEAAGSEDVSSRRREYVAMYREGLRGVLQEAVESLQEMLLGAMAESEGEDEDEQ